MPSLIPFADADHYATRQGDPGVNAAQIGVLLYEASALIRKHVTDVDARIAAGTLDRLIVAGVACDAVQRYLANPTRASQLGEGPFVASYAAANAKGLWLTEDDLASLAPSSITGSTPGVGTIRVSLPMGTVPRWSARW